MSKHRSKEKKHWMDAGDYGWLHGVYDGNCWICRKPESVANRSLAIDHDHETGQVRGLLCTRCNQTLGRMDDDPEIFKRAALYLESSRRVWGDCCRRCEDMPVVTPHSIKETDGTNTMFWYQCDAGHLWVCSWRTKGIPLGWVLR